MKGRAMDSDRCSVCAESALQEIEEFRALTRVTSDTKAFPSGGRLAVCGACGAAQKPADAVWREEANRIYADYEIYYLSDGAEQPVFDLTGRSAPRSQILFDFFLKHAPLPRTGRLLDVGCGNGAALTQYSRGLPDWDLHGFELSDKAATSLALLPNFKGLYVGDLDSIQGRFGFISLIHSLEHMPDPAETLRRVRDLLEEDGTLLIEVPDVETSPFDILVADHRSHFSRDSLQKLVSDCGFDVSFVSNEVLPKEVTLIAAPAESGDARSMAANPNRSLERMQATVHWLGQVAAAASRSAAKTAKFGVFGTSVSSMWLYGAVGEQVSFFVDEDRTRVGRDVDGRPILAPEDVPSDACVFVPLVPHVAARVVERLRGGGGRFIVPPLFQA